MKIKYKLNKLILILTVVLVGCSDVLDKSDLTAVNAEDVWNDENLAEGFLNEIYDRSLIGWSNGASGNSDDANGQNSLMYGERTSNSVGSYRGNFAAIKDINLLLEQVGTGTLDVAFQESLKSQALFFRAQIYFSLISTYGGVPIVLSVSQISDDLEIPRNKTSECLDQIIIDLDNAISKLPENYDDPGSNYGRITKGAAMAFKAKVLINYASEQFDPAQSSGRWQTAYDAIKTAKANLEANGKGLHSDYSDLWFDQSDGNIEAIMIRRYTTDKSHRRDAGVRPFVVGTNGENWDKPTISHIDAYPMKDGKAIDDPSSAYTYNATSFWENRDPRFKANIAYNSSIWALNDPEPQKTSDVHWAFKGSAVEGQADTRISPSALYCRKAVDGSIIGGAATLTGTTDWIEIRFADILLYLAEAANEIGSIPEAYTVLIDIRSRAGIDSGGDGLYGLQAGMSQGEMRDAILLERRIELAFEAKRSADLRRRRMYNTLNGTFRKGYFIDKTAAFDALDPSDQILDDRKVLEAGVLDGSIDLNDPTVYNTYFTTVLTSLERDGNTTDDGIAINYLDQYYFFDLPQSAIDKNPKLEQTQGWPGGTFDPLQ